MPITPLMMQAVRNGAAMAAPSPTPTPTPTPSALLFDFRQNATPGGTFPGDPAGANGITLASTWNGSHGWTNPGVAAADSGRAIDGRIWGHNGLSTGTMTFAAVAAAGNYYLQFAMGAVNVDAIRTAAIVVDSCDSGLRAAGLSAILGASGSVTSGQYYITNDQQRLYKCITSGTYTTGNMTGTGSDLLDGGSAHFAFMGYTIYIYDSVSGTGHLKSEVVDVDTTWRTEAAWGSSPGQKAVSISALTPTPGVTILRYPGVTGYPRHLGLISR